MYELVRHDVKAGLLSQFEHIAQEGMPSRLAFDYPKPVGMWYSEFGPGQIGTNLQLHSLSTVSTAVETMLPAYVAVFLPPSLSSPPSHPSPALSSSSPSLPLPPSPWPSPLSIVRSCCNDYHYWCIHFFSIFHITSCELRRESETQRWNHERSSLEGDM